MYESRQIKAKGESMTAEQEPAGENDRQGRGKDTRSLSAKFLAVLSEREQRLVQELAYGEYQRTRAMLKAGFARSTAYKQQARVIDRPRVQRALLAIEYEREGPERLTNDELQMIGVNVRSVRQRERRKQEVESKAEARIIVAQILARRRR
jgi:hypothetical protein